MTRRRWQSKIRTGRARTGPPLFRAEFPEDFAFLEGFDLAEMLRAIFFPLVNVDRAACVSVANRVEERGRILQRCALGEGKLHDLLVGFSSADDAIVRPNRSAHPLPLLDDVRVCFLDELPHSAEGFPAPVPEFGDSFRDELGCRLALARARLFHVLILERFPSCYIALVATV